MGESLCMNMYTAPEYCRNGIAFDTLDFKGKSYKFIRKVLYAVADSTFLFGGTKKCKDNNIQVCKLIPMLTYNFLIFMGYFGVYLCNTSFPNNNLYYPYNYKNCKEYCKVT